jgi:hypothetical protein
VQRGERMGRASVGLTLIYIPSLATPITVCQSILANAATSGPAAAA